jgi:AcrR family transcriptional regulator
MSTGKTDTRAALLDATIRILDAKGALHSLEDVATEAGVSRQALYLHFKGKSELLLAAVEHAKRAMGFDMLAQRIPDAADADAMLDAFLDLHFAFTPRIFSVARALEGERSKDAALEEAWQARESSRRRMARRVAERFAAERRLARGTTIDEASDLLWAITSPALTEDLLVRCRWPRGRLEGYLRAIIHAALVRPKSTNKEKRT